MSQSQFMEKTKRKSGERVQGMTEIEEGEWMVSDEKQRIDEELCDLRVEIDVVKREHRVISSETENLNQRLAQLEGDNLWNTLNDFKNFHEQSQADVLTYGKPLAVHNSWRQNVNEKPEIKWSLENFSYFENYVLLGNLTPTLSCSVSVEETSSAYIPRLSLKLDFEDEVTVETPAVFVSVTGKNRAGLLKNVVERYHAMERGSSRRRDYCGDDTTEPTSHLCVSLDIELYLEMPRCVRQVQSEDGTLMWTVQNFRQFFANEGSVAYSPYFRTLPRGYRMQALLYNSKANSMTLLVVRRSDYVRSDFSDYVVRVTVYRPNGEPNERNHFTFSDLKRGEECDLGSMENIVENDTFLCRVQVLCGC